MGRLELSRAVIFESVRQGFAAAYDTLIQHDPERAVRVILLLCSC